MSLADAWGEVVERIVQGFTHDLNNHLLVLVGVRDLLEPPEPADEGLLELFDRELDGLEDETRLLRRLVVPDTEAEPCDPREILDAARKLHRRHRGLQGVELEWTLGDGLPAVHASPSDILRAILLALAATAHTALARGADTGEIRAGVEGDHMVLTLSPGGGAGDLDAAADAAHAAAFVSAARAAVVRAGGGLEEAGGGLEEAGDPPDGSPGALRLWLPALRPDRAGQGE